MHCPVCQADNYAGDDLCSNCGADLHSAESPGPETGLVGRRLGASLDALGAPEPQTIDADADVAEAIRRMRADRIDCLLVMEGGRLVGIFTDRDAVLKIAGRAERPRTIREVMTPDPVVLDHELPIATAINRMAVGEFRHIVVVRYGRPVAVISAPDIFRYLAGRIG